MQHYFKIGFQKLALACLAVSCLFFFTCTSPQKTENTSLINTDHLDHLYESINIDGRTLGTIWIYAEAPDYHLVADDDEGFTCVDDVARALVFYVRQYAHEPNEKGLEKIRSLTEFLLYMQADNGYFYNFLLPGPQINKTHQNSLPIANWWSWRAFWALSEMGLLKEEKLTELQNRSRPVMDTLIGKMEQICPTTDSLQYFEGIPTPDCLVDLGSDQPAVMMVGLTNYYRQQPSERVKLLLTRFGNLLLKTQQGDAKTPPHFAFLSWRNYWHAWGNSQAYALLYAGRVLQNQPFIEAGLNEVRYFYPYCLKNGFMSGFKMAVENDQPVVKDIQPFSQIAYGLRPMVYASLEAFAITGDTTFAETAGKLGTWLFGSNPANQTLYDSTNGRTFDGIGSPSEVNKNSGAESTIEGLLTLQAIELRGSKRMGFCRSNTF
ncbi:MAG: hypothetical protein R2825_21540 [Saprospiraceae bacterium]